MKQGVPNQMPLPEPLQLGQTEQHRPALPFGERAKMLFLSDKSPKAPLQFSGKQRDARRHPVKLSPRILRSEDRPCKHHHGRRGQFRSSRLGCNPAKIPPGLDPAYVT